MGENGLDWLCYVAGNFQTAPRIFFIFSGYYFWIISLRTHKPEMSVACTFLPLNISAVGSVHRLVPTYFGNVPTGLDSWPWLGTVVKINNRHQETRFYPSWIPFSTCVSRFHICFIRRQHKHHSEKIYFWKMIHSWHQTTKIFIV